MWHAHVISGLPCNMRMLHRKTEIACAWSLIFLHFSRISKSNTAHLHRCIPHQHCYPLKNLIDNVLRAHGEVGPSNSHLLPVSLSIFFAKQVGEVHDEIRRQTSQPKSTRNLIKSTSTLTSLDKLLTYCMSLIAPSKELVWILKHKDPSALSLATVNDKSTWESISGLVLKRFETFLETTSFSFGFMLPFSTVIKYMLCRQYPTLVSSCCNFLGSAPIQTLMVFFSLYYLVKPLNVIFLMFVAHEMCYLKLKYCFESDRRCVRLIRSPLVKEEWNADVWTSGKYMKIKLLE